LTEDWRCSHWQIDSVDRQPPQPQGKLVARYRRWNSPYYKAALRYYDRARALSPDDSTIRCNAAVVRAELGDPHMMKELQKDPQSHLALADSLRDRAGRAANFGDYYALALEEYTTAINMAPTDLGALNGYAYTFWLWRVRTPNGPGPEVAH